MFDSTQLSALKEFLPTDDEHKALQDYLKDREHDMNAAMADLSECEKYMAAMMKVDNAASKFDCMIFMVQFNGRIDELVDGITIITKACDEVRSSERLRKMMAMILTLVNEINTGGDGNVAVGFSLDALLKLHEVRK
jgi:formin 2